MTDFGPNPGSRVGRKKSSGGGAVSSVSNSDGTLTITPTTGAVVAKIALGHANTWTAAQALGSSTATTQAGGDNSTKLATTAYVASYAPLASPTFTGTVVIPTPYTIGAVSMTATGTQLNYLAAATGTTGTTSTNVVFSTSPTLITPALGTPSALVLTNATALPAAQVSSGALVNGMTATTQAAADNSTKLATTAYADRAATAPTWLGAPGGRLSLTSGVAVQTADVVAGTHVYYVPYIHDQLPVIGLALAGQVDLALDSVTPSQASGKLYDLFLFNNSGTIVLGTGAAWTNLTTRNQAIDQTTVAGIWTNTGTITLTYDATPHTVSCTAGKGLYVGTMYASANGQCTCQFNPAAAAGGSNTIIGLFNAYNRIKGSASSEDSTASWTYASATWRKANNNQLNRISWLDGLGVLFTTALYATDCQLGTSSAGNYGTNINATTGAPNFIGSLNGGAVVADDVLTNFPAIDHFAPVLGYNFAQAMEQTGAGAGTTTFFGGGFTEQIIQLEV